MKFLIHILLQGLLIYTVGQLMDGVSIASYSDAVLAAFLLALANTFVKPILTILTLPATILTLGLFLFVVNGLVVLLVDALLTGLVVDGLFSAIVFSIVFSFFNYLFLNFYSE